MATANHGSIGAFDPDMEEWRSYIEHFKQYCTSNDIADGKKRAVLLSCCGPKTFSLIRGLVAPEKPGEKTYEALTELVGKHYSPAPSSKVFVT